mgnify:FL=1|jgi:hypothetical protein
MRPWMDRLKSRKFLMALATALLMILNEGLDLGIPADVYGWIVGVVIAWILGESYVDGRAAGGGE